MDGLPYGDKHAVPLNVPFLLLYSDDGADIIDFLMQPSDSTFHAIHIVNSRHADFTDMSLIWPMMKWYGQSGTIPGERMIDLPNTLVLNFLDHYLKDQPYENFRQEDYPELEFETISLDIDSHYR